MPDNSFEQKDKSTLEMQECMPKKYWRHRTLLIYNDGRTHDCGFYFSELNPEQFIKEKNDISAKEYEERMKDIPTEVVNATPFEMSNYMILSAILSQRMSWDILLSHEITEQDYNDRKKYSIPINQYIFKTTN